MLPGGFSGGDEPDGSGKFIAAMFRNPRIKEEVMNLLQKRDGLMLGICNGFRPSSSSALCRTAKSATSRRIPRR